MSVNSSFNSSSHNWSDFKDCLIISLVFVVNRIILLLPLSVLILCLGHQQWRQKRSFATTSHSDFFAFNAGAMELVFFLGSALFFCSYFADLPDMMGNAGYSLTGMSYFGHNFLHVLACVERYLAVVHPVTYMGLREARGVRIRNISVGCVWLLSSLLASFVTLPGLYYIVLLCALVFSLVVVSFCSLSVLRVLMRPMPGDGGRNKGRVDQSKQKAFFTIAAITVALWFWFFGFIVAMALNASPLLSPGVKCVFTMTALWFSLPSNSVLPLLYLHRKGKPPCCH